MLLNVTPISDRKFSRHCFYKIDPIVHAKGISVAVQAGKRSKRGGGGRLWTARTRHAYPNYVGGAKRIFITLELELFVN